MVLTTLLPPLYGEGGARSATGGEAVNSPTRAGFAVSSLPIKGREEGKS